MCCFRPLRFESAQSAYARFECTQQNKTKWNKKNSSTPAAPTTNSELNIIPQHKIEASLYLYTKLYELTPRSLNATPKIRFRVYVFVQCAVDDEMNMLKLVCIHLMCNEAKCSEGILALLSFVYICRISTTYGCGCLAWSDIICNFKCDCATHSIYAKWLIFCNAIIMPTRSKQKRKQHTYRHFNKVQSTFFCYLCICIYMWDNILFTSKLLDVSCNGMTSKRKYNEQ